MVWLDPLMGIALAVAIFWISWGLMQDAVNMELDAVPHGVNPTEVHSYLSSLRGVSSMHRLHVWAVSTTETALTVHLVCPDDSIDDVPLMKTLNDLNLRYGIRHSTIQIETGAQECPLTPTDVD